MTITSVGFQVGSPYEVVYVRVAPDSDPLDMGDFSDYIPFRPFRIAPGGIRQVEVVGRFVNSCPPTDEGWTTQTNFSTIAVGFRTLFVGRSSILYMPNSFEIDQGNPPTGGKCS